MDLLIEYRFGRAAAATSPAQPTDSKAITQMALADARRNTWLDGTAVRVGVRNIFDDPPPFANNVAGYPVPLEDPRQRFIFIDIEKRF